LATDRLTLDRPSSSAEAAPTLPVAGERLKLARDTLCADCVSTKMLRGGMSVAAGAVSGQREDALDWRIRDKIIGPLKY
jgi:hypothetical protein